MNAFLAKHNCVTEICPQKWMENYVRSNIESKEAIQRTKDHFIKKYKVIVNRQDGVIVFKKEEYKTDEDFHEEVESSILFKLDEIQDINKMMTKTKDRFIINGELQNIIIQTLNIFKNKTSDEKGIAKQIVRSALTSKLCLSSRDVIFLNSNKTVIRTFVSAEVREKKEMYEFANNGYKKYYKDKNIEGLLLNAKNTLLKNDFNFGRPGANHLFYNSFEKRLYKEIIKLLIKDCDEEKNKAVKIARIILAKEIDNILELCAKDLLDLIHQGNVPAKDFIKWFNGDMEILSNGHRIIKPELYSETKPDDKGQDRLPPHSSIPLMSQFKTKTSLIQKEKRTLAGNLKNKTIAEEKFKKEKELYDSCLKNRDEMKLKSDRLERDLNQYQISLSRNIPYISRDEDGDRMTIEISDIPHQITIARNECARLKRELEDMPKNISNAQNNKRQAEHNFNGYKNMVEASQRQLKRYEEAMEPIKKRYNTYVYAIKNALTQKPKKAGAEVTAA